MRDAALAAVAEGSLEVSPDRGLLLDESVVVPAREKAHQHVRNGEQRVAAHRRHHRHVAQVVDPRVVRRIAVELFAERGCELLGRAVAVGIFVADLSERSVVA